MTLRSYLILFSLATAVAWAGWILVLVAVDPFTAGNTWLAIFYLSLAFALFGFFSLIGFFFRVWFSEEQRLFKHLSVATRQGGLLAVFVCALLLLQASNFLSWWNIGLLIIVLALIEYFFQPQESKNSKTNDSSPENPT